MKSRLKYSRKSPDVLSTSAYDNKLFAACNGLATNEATLAVIPDFFPIIVSSISNCVSENCSI